MWNQRYLRRLHDVASMAYYTKKNNKTNNKTQNKLMERARMMVVWQHATWLLIIGIASSLLFLAVLCCVERCFVSKSRIYPAAVQQR